MSKNDFLASTVPAPIQTPNTGRSLLLLVSQIFDIGWQDMVEHMVDGQNGPLFALLTTKEVHGVENDA